MASDVEIANRALVKLGAATITDFLDGTETANKVNGLYAIVRDAELRAHRWNFAMKRTTLAALGDPPPWGFSKQFQLPADLLALDSVNDTLLGHVNLGTDYRNAELLPYAVEGRILLCDFAAPLKLRYVARVTDPSQFDALFVEAFACRLAMEMAEALTQSNSKRQLAIEEYKRAIRLARSKDAMEGPPEPIPDDAWMLSRIGP